ncbi:hypothetical protein LCGC14_0514720 [marine sediment metagenome]|uniref:Uncharacterized protein n=1 Tax=marine sediment metagenome TaxID=412755 RepID=A0A0F9V8M7_9ZZZZ
MTYVIKRKFRGLLGDDVDNSQMTSFIQHVQTSDAGVTQTLPSLMDSLTVNHLVVKRTLKIPARTDGYK